MIPQSLLGDEQISKTLIEALEALKRRLARAGDHRIGGQAWAVHEGEADPTNLPNVDIGVWIMLESVLPDPDSPFQSDGFFGIWKIQVLVKDQGADPHGFALVPAMMVFGGLINVMTETNADVSMDESVETVEHLGMQQAIGRIAAGDRRFLEMQTRFRAMHPLLQHTR